MCCCHHHHHQDRRTGGHGSGIGGVLLLWDRGRTFNRRKHAAAFASQLAFHITAESRAICPAKVSMMICGGPDRNAAGRQSAGGCSGGCGGSVRTP